MKYFIAHLLRNGKGLPKTACRHGYVLCLEVSTCEVSFTRCVMVLACSLKHLRHYLSVRVRSMLGSCRGNDSTP